MKIFVSSLFLFFVVDALPIDLFRIKELIYPQHTICYRLHNGTDQTFNGIKVEEAYCRSCSVECGDDLDTLVKKLQDENCDSEDKLKFRIQGFCYNRLGKPCMGGADEGYHYYPEVMMHYPEYFTRDIEQLILGEPVRDDCVCLGDGTSGYKDVESGKDEELAETFYAGFHGAKCQYRNIKTDASVYIFVGWTVFFLLMIGGCIGWCVDRKYKKRYPEHLATWSAHFMKNTCERHIKLEQVLLEMNATKLPGLKIKTSNHAGFWMELLLRTKYVLVLVSFLYVAFGVAQQQREDQGASGGSALLISTCLLLLIGVAAIQASYGALKKKHTFYEWLFYSVAVNYSKPAKPHKRSENVIMMICSVFIILLNWSLVSWPVRALIMIQLFVAALFMNQARTFRDTLMPFSRLMEAGYPIIEGWQNLLVVSEEEFLQYMIFRCKNMRAPGKGYYIPISRDDLLSFLQELKTGQITCEPLGDIKSFKSLLLAKYDRFYGIHPLVFQGDAVAPPTDPSQGVPMKPMYHDQPPTYEEPVPQQQAPLNDRPQEQVNPYAQEKTAAI